MRTLRPHAHLYSQALGEAQLIGGGRPEGGPRRGACGAAEALQLELGGHLDDHQAVLLQEVQRHLAHGAARHHHARAAVRDALDVLLQLGLLGPGVEGEQVGGVRRWEAWESGRGEQVYGRGPPADEKGQKCAVSGLAFRQAAGQGSNGSTRWNGLVLFCGAPWGACDLARPRPAVLITACPQNRSYETAKLYTTNPRPLASPHAPTWNSSPAPPRS